MDRKQFFDDADKVFASFSQQKLFKNMWEKIEEYEKKIGKTLDDSYTKEEYVELFNFMFTRRASSFSNQKSVVMFYVRYLIAQGTLSEEHEKVVNSITTDSLSIKKGTDRIRIRYFKNLNHLRYAIEDTVKSAGRVDDTVFDVPSAIFYLAWYGLTDEQIISLKKADVLEDGIMLYGEKIEMADFVTDLLIRLRDAEGFYVQCRWVTPRKYIYSDYLIRTGESAKLTISQMRANTSRMDKIMDHTYSLNFKTVRQSGIFYRAFMLECDSTKNAGFNLNDPEFASKVFLEDFTNRSDTRDSGKRLRDRTRDYTLYKQLFF